MRRWLGAALVVVLAWVSPAVAEGEHRAQGFWIDLHTGGGATHTTSTEPAILYGLGGGFVLNEAATFALGFELQGLTSWSSSRRLDRGAAMVAATMWFDDRVSLALGAGTPVGPAAIGEGFAAFARAGYEVVRWQRSGVVMSLDVTEDTTSGLQVSGLIGVAIFTHEKTMNLSDPNRW